jgi:TPP-dependent pyruvate/acetoin dehydrogenase alpha subunit
MPTATKPPRPLEAKQEHYNKMMAEVLGKSGGYCKGKGGSMHIADVDHGNLGATGIVGGNIPVAVGAALAQKLMGTDRVVVCFFGDGASNTGNFHESLNMASCGTCRSCSWSKTTCMPCRCRGTKPPSCPMLPPGLRLRHPGEVVDGMDALAVRGSVLKAVERARRGEGPTLVECKTYRWYGHSHSDPRAYRTREEEAQWKLRDPITVLKEDLQSVRMLTDERI